MRWKGERVWDEMTDFQNSFKGMRCSNNLCKTAEHVKQMQEVLLCLKSVEGPYPLPPHPSMSFLPLRHPRL